MFGSLGFIAHLPILQSIFSDLHTGADLTFGGYRIYVNRWGTLRLTDRARSLAASTTTSETANVGAKSLQSKAPAHTATPRVIRATRRSPIFHSTHNNQDEATGWESCDSSNMPPPHNVPFQVFMMKPGRPTPVEKGKDIDPNNQGGTSAIGTNNEPANDVPPGITPHPEQYLSAS